MEGHSNHAALPPNADSTATSRPRRFRFTLGFLMVLVLTTTVATALFLEIRRLLQGTGASTLNTDFPAIVLLGILLNAVALGSWRRFSGVQILVQMTICYVLILGGIWLVDWHWRGFRYWFQVCFAVTVVVPLVLRRLAGGDEGRIPEGPLAAIIDSLLFSSLNLLGMAITIVFQGYLLMIME